VNELTHKYPEEIERLLAKYPANFRKSAVMPLLYLAQRKLGYLTKVQLAEVAEITGMSITDVDSVAGFYSLFHEQEGSASRPVEGSASRPVEGSASRPVEGGRYRVQVCTDLPCALRGAEEFLSQLCQNIGIKVGETTPDGAVTIEEVTCLAGCHRRRCSNCRATAILSIMKIRRWKKRQAWWRNCAPGARPLQGLRHPRRRQSHERTDPLASPGDPQPGPFGCICAARRFCRI